MDTLLAKLRHMFGKLTGSFDQINSRQTKKTFFFDNFERASSPARPLTDLKTTAREQHAGAHVTQRGPAMRAAIMDVDIIFNTC